MTSTSSGVSLVYALTDLGHSRAEEYLRLSQYTGPAPVSLAAYTAQIQRQTIANLTVTRADMLRAFAGIVIAEPVLDRFGAAMNSGRAIFVYGPAGAGKTFIAERLVALLEGSVYIPHAILVENQVIQIFDPLSHRPVREVTDLDMAALAHGRGADRRWVLCARPFVIAGGELTLGMLDLQFDRGARYYAAPPQLKANNGMFVVDDLGRQLVKPKDLMNRWIVPLDRRVDYMALHTGEKFTVPFDVIVVFSTNLSPTELADEAFLRRLGYKIHLGAVDEAQYREICVQVCREHAIQCDDQTIDYLIAQFKKEQRPLLACTPRDLLSQVRHQALYRGAPPALTRELLDWAWKNYFADPLIG